MTLLGHIFNGEIVLDQPIALPEGAAVQVEVIELRPGAESAGDRDAHKPSLLERLGDVVGAIDDLPADGARNLDQYLYGASNR